MNNIVHFDTSVWEWFYPRGDVCARTKRGWKGHTKIKSLSHVSNIIFLYDVYRAWFSACFFIQAVKKYCLLHVRKMILHSCDCHPRFARARTFTLVLESTLPQLYRKLLYYYCNKIKGSSKNILKFWPQTCEKLYDL